MRGSRMRTSTFTEWVLGWVLNSLLPGRAHVVRHPGRDLGDELARQRELGCTRQFAHALGVDQEQAVVVLPEGQRADVADEQRNALALALGLGVLREIFAFRGKA